MSNKGSKSRKEIRKKFAMERQEEAKSRTPQAQIKNLDRMFGVGLGAMKERAKLAKRIAGVKEEVVAPEEP